MHIGYPFIPPSAHTLADLALLRSHISALTFQDVCASALSAAQRLGFTLLLGGQVRGAVRQRVCGGIVYGEHIKQARQPRPASHTAGGPPLARGCARAALPEVQCLPARGLSVCALHGLSPS